MTSYLEILTSVKEAVEERFAGETCYINMVPTDFARPSFLAEIVTAGMTPASFDCLSVTVSVKVSAFVEVDPYYHSQTEDLLLRLASVQELFCGCSFPVGDRRLHVEEAKGAVPGLDFAECQVRFAYQDQRPDGETAWPMIKTVRVDVQGE